VATKRQHIGNQINAAFIIARSDFVSVERRLHERWILNHFFIVVWSAKEAESAEMEHWQKIADSLRKAGFSWGCSSDSDSTGRVLFTADAYAPDGRRFTVLADDRLTAFLELHAAIPWTVTDLTFISPRMSAFSPIVSTPLDLILPSTFPSMRSSFSNLIEPLISTSLGITQVVFTDDARREQVGKTA
jgi:hypothetical protein